MATPNPYAIHIFISHSWAYDEHYEKLAEWVFETSWNVDGVPLQFVDYSVPKSDPIHYASNDRELKQAIDNRIANTHVVVIPSGMYATHSKWIQKEIDGAQDFRRPILAVNPYGQERKAGVVLDAAQEGVGWNKKSVINGIWKLYRNQ